MAVLGALLCCTVASTPLHACGLTYDVENRFRFPVFHAAPMAQYGSSKDIGPFTEGCESYRFYMNHQYGTMDVTDDGCTL